jgi:RIO-like serine/threonine protein kinase
MSDIIRGSFLLSDNGISRVVRDGKWVYKTQPKYLTDNEWWALVTLESTGYVPRYAERIDVSTVKMEYVETEPVTDTKQFMDHYQQVLDVLRKYKLRHGDLSCYAVLVRNNQPVIIDWAESRTWYDPRPAKRHEGDAYWLHKAMSELCKK